MKGYRYIEGQEKPFSCRQCGRSFSSEGGYNLHGPCGPGYKTGYRQGKNRNSQGPGACPCGGSKRLLREGVELESRAIKAGATSICTKCEELF